MTRNWFQMLAGRFNFPRDYTAVDIETNGVVPTTNFICAVGHTRVRNNEPTETEEVFLDWTRHPGVDQRAFRDALDTAEAAMRAQGKAFHHNYERLRSEGKPPLEVLERYLAMFEDMEARGEILIAHNGWRFDMEFFQAHFHNWLRIPYVFADEMVYDTGMCEKASQLDDRDDPLPMPGETMKQFSLRIGNLRRRGIMWALDKHCDAKYHLFDKVGAKRDLAHTAGQDSLVLVQLFEEHRKLAQIADRLVDTDVEQTVVIDSD